MTRMADCGIVERIVAVLRRNAEEIERLRPAQITIHLPPPEDRNAEPCLELGKIKLR
jgi:hypothetical protein